MNVRVTYRSGTFVPTDDCTVVVEGSKGIVVLDSGILQPPAVADPEQRRRILQEVVQEIRQNPLPSCSPRFTRDELHERR